MRAGLALSQFFPMNRKAAALILLSFILSGIAKATADAVAFFGTATALFQILPESLHSWYIGGPGFNQGYVWSCDLWHLSDGHLRQLFHAAGVLAAAYLFWDLKARKLWQLLLLCFLGYWLEGAAFKLFYHVVLTDSWSLAEYLQRLIF